MIYHQANVYVLSISCTVCTKTLNLCFLLTLCSYKTRWKGCHKCSMYLGRWLLSKKMFQKVYSLINALVWPSCISATVASKTSLRSVTERRCAFNKEASLALPRHEMFSVEIFVVTATRSVRITCSFLSSLQGKWQDSREPHVCACS